MMKIVAITNDPASIADVESVEEWDRPPVRWIGWIRSWRLWHRCEREFTWPLETTEWCRCCRYRMIGTRRWRFPTIED
jgi:hypothetical protein